MKRPTTHRIILPLILLVGIMACGGKSDVPYERTNPPRENELRYDVNAPFSTLNPVKVEFSGSTHVFPLLYSCLFIPGNDGTLQPDLALTWYYDRNISTWTIRIRRDAVFHNGRPVTPEDVVYSLNTTLSAYHQSLAFNLNKIFISTDHTISIQLKNDDPEFLKRIWDTAIIPKPDGRDVDFFNHPIGSGPFKFKSRKGNLKVVLEANKEYYGGRPLVEKVIFVYQPDREKAWTRLLAAESDIAQEITPKNFEMLKRYKERFYFDRYTLQYFTILLFNTYDPLFSDPHVRRAMTYMIDRKYIVKKILKGYGKIANGPMGVDSPFHNPEVKPLAFDPKKAIKLLQKAGWSFDNTGRYLQKNSRPFEFTILLFKESQLDKKVARYIQLCLNDLGIKVNLQAIEFEKLKRRYSRNTDFQAVLTEFNGAYLNPEYLDRIWSGDFGKKSNAGCFNNPEVARLLKKGLEEKNLEKRKRIFFKIDEIISSLQPGTFLFQKTAIDAMSKRFQLPFHFSLTYQGIYRLRLATLK